MFHQIVYTHHCHGFLIIDRHQKCLKKEELKNCRQQKMIQRLPIRLPQVKVGNRFENFSNQVKQVVYSIVSSKADLKKDIQ